MRALTIQQPWATLVAVGEKEIETRGWKPRRHPGEIAIHSGLKKPGAKQVEQPHFLKALLRHGIRSRNDLLLGHVIAVATVGDIVATDELTEAGEIGEQEISFGDFRSGRYGWILTNVIKLPEPVPVKGKLGLWKMDEETARKVRQNL